MLSEEIISSQRQIAQKRPVCWLVCYKDRPLQGIPPNSDGPHLLVYSTQWKARSFLKARRKYFEEEPLSIVGIDTIDILKDLVLTPARDPDYSPPPSGVVIDFEYSLKKPYTVISPEDAREIDARKLAHALHKKYPLEKTDIPGTTGPAIKSRRWITIAAGSLAGMLGIVCCIAIGALAWTNLKQVPAIAGLDATQIPSTTPAASSTSKPVTLSTKLPTLTPEPGFLAYAPEGDEVILQESFDNNDNLWKSYYPGKVAAVTEGHIRVVSYETGYVNTAVCSGCGDYVDNFYFQADLALNKFKNISYGLVFCTSENNNYYVYLINHNSFKYSLFKLKDDEWITLIDTTLSDRINGYPHNNTLSVYFEQGYMELFINGFKVDTYNDTESLRGGWIGLIVEDAGAELYGDNVFSYVR